MAVLSSKNGDHERQDAFDISARRCGPLPTLVALAFGIAVIDLPMDLYDCFLFSLDSFNTYSTILDIVQCVLKILSFAVLIAHIYLRFQRKQQLPVFKTYSLSHWLQLTFCSLFTTASIIHLMNHSVWSHLESPYLLADAMTSSHSLRQPRTQISMAALTVMILPLLLGAVFSDALREVIWVWWLLCMASLIAVAVLNGSLGYGLVVGYYFLLSGLIFYAMRQNTLLELLKEQLQAKDQQEALDLHDLNMKHIVANVAHDLKTPLSSFMAGVQVLAELLGEAQAVSAVPPPLPLVDLLSSAEVCLANISNTNHFMLMTINRCIDYTKTSNGLKLVPQYDTVHLLDALSLPLNCMKSIQQRVTIAMEPMPFQISKHVITDRQWLQENLLCLLSNAVKYSAGGLVTVSVKLIGQHAGSAGSTELDEQAPFAVSRKAKDVSLSKVLPNATADAALSVESPNRSDKIILVEVEDSGIGMTEQAMATLFSPFSQTQRMAGGTGLGLFSLAKRTEALQGSSGVRRRADGKQGSVFWFSFPYRPDDNALTSVRRAGFDTASCKTMLTAAPLDENRRILLVDDSPSIVKLTKMLLCRHGFDVIVAENGAVALDIIQDALRAQDASCVYHTAFDVILMDLQMPVMDGLEAVKRLRLLEQSHRVRHLIVGLSANSDDDTRYEVQMAGFDNFLSKPFSHQAFAEILSQSC